MNNFIHYFFICYHRIKLRLLGVSFGKDLRIYDRIYIKRSKRASLIIGDGLTYTSGSGLNPICSNNRGVIRLDDSANVVIGNNCGMSSTILWAKESITIGNNVLIGGGTLIMDCDRHSLDFRIRNGSIRNEYGKKIDSQSAKTAPIVIEDDVLIGARVIILKGVKIGAHSIIGAGSVVTKDIPSDVIAGGNPCKVIQSIEMDQ